jgi:hypothetical protein
VLRDFTILPVTAAAGLTAGGGLLVLLAAALSAAGAVWLKHLRPPGGLCFANMDPQKPESALFLTAFRETLASARRTMRPVRLRLACFFPTAHPVFRLDLSRDNDLEFSYDLRKSALMQPGVWLADHPLPLVLPHTRSLTLVFEPCGASRIRVSLDAGTPCPMRHWLLLALLATVACALDLGWLLAAALGFALQTCLLEQHPQRAPQDARVQRH